jgi:dihydrofolate reductase
MARIRGCIAASLDGYIPNHDGGVDWLSPYEDADFGEHAYASFIAGVRTVVLGRATFDFVANGSTA